MNMLMVYISGDVMTASRGRMLSLVNILQWQIKNTPVEMFMPVHRYPETSPTESLSCMYSIYVLQEAMDGL